MKLSTLNIGQEEEEEEEWNVFFFSFHIPLCEWAKESLLKLLKNRKETQSMGILMQNVRKIKRFKSLVVELFQKKKKRNLRIKLSKIVMAMPLPT